MFVPIVPHRRHGRLQRRAQVASAVSGAIAAVLGAGIAGARRGGHVSTPWIAGVIGGIALGLIIFLVFRRLNTPDRDTEDTPTSASDATIEDRRHWLMVLVAIIAGLLGLGLFLSASAKQAASQEPDTQWAYVITMGNDTLVVERVQRGRTGFTADIAMKGRGRMIYTAAVVPGPAVPQLTFRAWGPGAPVESAPLQSGTLTINSDSAFLVVSVAGSERKVNKAATGHPVPLMNNDFAVLEIAVQRAKAQAKDGKATVALFALNGAVQLDATFEFIGSDSVILRVAGQENRLGLTKSGGIAGGTIKGQPVLITRLDGPAAARIALGKPDYSAPADAPYTAEDVTVKTPAGHVLTGTLTMPKGAKGKVPAVVTISGSGQQDRDSNISLVRGYRPFRQIADTLGRRGIAVLRMDDRGINGSGGDLSKATSADFADDIRAGIAFLRARTDIDGARIALVGHSEGGYIGPMIAATDAKLKGIALMAGPSYKGRHISEIQNDSAIAQAPGFTKAQRDSLRRLVPGALDSLERDPGWIGFYMKHDPIATAKSVKVPVLILQGTTDQQITPEQAPLLEQAFKSGGNKDVTRVMFTDRNHLFLRDSVGSFMGYSALKNGAVEADVLGTLADWFVKRLKP